MLIKVLLEKKSILWENTICFTAVHISVVKCTICFKSTTRYNSVKVHANQINCCCYECPIEVANPDIKLWNLKKASRQVADMSYFNFWFCCFFVKLYLSVMGGSYCILEMMASFKGVRFPVTAVFLIVKGKGSGITTWHCRDEKWKNVSLMTFGEFLLVFSLLYKKGRALPLSSEKWLIATWKGLTWFLHLD